jgi:hypothetical protein
MAEETMECIGVGAGEEVRKIREFTSLTPGILEGEGKGKGRGRPKQAVPLQVTITIKTSIRTRRQDTKTPKAPSG